MLGYSLRQVQYRKQENCFGTAAVVGDLSFGKGIIVTVPSLTFTIHPFPPASDSFSFQRMPCPNTTMSVCPFDIPWCCLFLHDSSSWFVLENFLAPIGPRTLHPLSPSTESPFVFLFRSIVKGLINPSNVFQSTVLNHTLAKIEQCDFEPRARHKGHRLGRLNLGVSDLMLGLTVIFCTVSIVLSKWNTSFF